MWKINEAIETIKPFESIAAIMGYHVALGGSVMYKGESTKDLDIIVYTHKVKDEKRPLSTMLMDLFVYNKLIADYNQLGNSLNFDPDRKVFGTMTKDRRRIDFIFI